MKKRIALFAAVGLLIMLVRTHADTIILDSGKSVTGEIVEENLDEVVVKLPSGVTTRISRDEIVEIKTKKDLEKEFQKKFRALGPGDMYGMLQLAQWCAQRGLKKQQRQLLESMLEMDPDDPDARRELDIMDGKLRPSARGEKRPSDSITFAPGSVVRRKKARKDEGEKEAQPGKGGQTGGETAPVGVKRFKEPLKGRNLWPDDKSKKVKCRSSKFKPKGTTDAALKALDWIMQNGMKTGWAPQGKISIRCFVGLACLASRDNKYTGLLDHCVNYVIKGLQRYLTGERKGRSKNSWGTQCNWPLSFGGIFLVECLPYYDSEQIRTTIQKTADQLVVNMEATGGWGHDAGGVNPLGYVELEIMSNFAVAFMGMARKEGFSVPKEKLAKAIAYIERCVTGRGVGYSHSNRGGHVSRSGGAVFALAMSGAKKSRKYPTLCNQVNRMMQHVRTGHSSPALSFLQCAIASLQISRGTWDKYVATWFGTIREHQQDDGSIKMIRNPKENIRFEENLGLAYTSGIYSLILLLDRSNLKYLSGFSRAK